MPKIKVGEGFVLSYLDNGKTGNARGGQVLEISKEEHEKLSAKKIDGLFSVVTGKEKEEAR